MSLNSFALLDIDRPNLEHSKRNPSSVNLEILEDCFDQENEFEGIVGHSAALREVLQLVETVAKGSSTVLLLGETGTGHERGAFTGAIAQKIGRLELADRGSLFLDEIGDIPLDLQPKLLRVLQEREFERLGSTRTTKVDVRVVAATHRDLEGMIANGQFRSDLYYRLNVFPIVIPPLRERPEDIPLLVQHFVEAAAQKMDKTIETIPTRTMDALVEYRWPGNIRELENVIERAVILSTGSVLHVPYRDLQSRVTPGHDGDKPQTLADVEREHIRATLKETRWVLSGPRGAASRLGMNRSTLYFRMKKLGIVRPWS